MFPPRKNRAEEYNETERDRVIRNNEILKCRTPLNAQQGSMQNGSPLHRKHAALLHTTLNECRTGNEQEIPNRRTGSSRTVRTNGIPGQTADEGNKNVNVSMSPPNAQ